MAIDKCAIAQHAHDYLHADREHWGKGAFVRDTDMEEDYDEENEAYAAFNEVKDCKVCLVGALIYGFWATGTPIVGYHGGITSEYRNFVEGLNIHVRAQTDGVWDNAISFNDDESTVYNEVIEMTESFAKEMCL